MKKFIFGIMLTIIGFTFSAFCFVYAVMNPCIHNGNQGLYYGFLTTYTLKPFIISFITMIIGLLICGYEAFNKDIRRGT